MGGLVLGSWFLGGLMGFVAERVSIRYGRGMRFIPDLEIWRGRLGGGFLSEK